MFQIKFAKMLNVVQINNFDRTYVANLLQMYMSTVRL